MSSFFADIAIWLLLFLGFAFGGLGFFGLLIFPDIRSRMFTASRATLIGTGLVILSVILYSITIYMNTGSEIYLTLVIYTLFLSIIIAVAALTITRIIGSQVAAEAAASGAAPPDNNA
jgi:multisubunit Na+/H+ antiporter MnhG subunit